MVIPFETGVVVYVAHDKTCNEPSMLNVNSIELNSRKSYIIPQHTGPRGPVSFSKVY